MNERPLLDALTEIQSAGHACRFEPSGPCVTFTSDWTTPDDVLRFRAAHPSLDKATIRCEIPE